MNRDSGDQPHSQHQRDEQNWSRWMAAAQQGDEQSYQKLLSSLGDAIAAYLRVKFGTVDFLEDCVQECLIAVHQGRHTYNPNRPFRPWLFAIVRHKAIDMLRQRGRQPATQSIAGEEGEQVLEQRLTVADAEALSVQDEVFEPLSPSFRQALVLTKVIGLSAREAAGQLGISEAAMKVRVHRAMQALRKALDYD